MDKTDIRLVINGGCIKNIPSWGLKNKHYLKDMILVLHFTDFNLLLDLY